MRRRNSWRGEERAGWREETRRRRPGSSRISGGRWPRSTCCRPCLMATIPLGGMCLARDMVVPCVLAVHNWVEKRNILAMEIVTVFVRDLTRSFWMDTKIVVDSVMVVTGSW